MRRCASTLLATLVLVILAAAPAQAAECRIGTAVDYAAPLAQLPPLPAIEGGRIPLPFGPAGLELAYGGAEKVFLPGSERVRFGLSAPDRQKPARLGWKLIARIVKVGEDGSRERRVSLDRRFVRALEPGGKRGLTLGLPGEPGYFRIEVEFRSRAGKRLGRFGEYVRELAGTYEARLSLDDTTLNPGAVLDPRLDNGAARLTFGLGAPIERELSGEWIPAPFGNGPVPELALFLEPGASARCWPTPIPADAPPGHYRVGLPLTYQTRTGRSPLGGNATPSVEFEVVP